MAVCRFFLRGNCRYGDRCRDEHPGKTNNPVVTRNPFAPLQNNAPNSRGNGPYQSSSSNRGSGDIPYKLDKNAIITDLSKERPQYILSAYGPGRDTPLQLFGGYPREQSFEEIRLYHYQLATSGNGQQAIQDVQNLLNNAEQQMQTALNDIDGAIKYIIDGEKQHPNRIDICVAKGGAITQTQTASGFEQPTSTFGQPSTFGHPSIISTFSQPASSTFGRPAATFGQPSAPGSAFGQPSSLVQQPSTFGQPSGFGQQSQLGRPSTSFGQPTSTFGQPSLSTPAFGQLAAPSVFSQGQQQPSAFAGPSALGTNQQNSAFAQPANSFGAPSALPQQGVFGQPSLPAAPNPLAQASAAPSSWGQPTSTSAPPPGSAFGHPAAVQPSPFRQAPTSQSTDPTINTTFGNPNSTSASSGSQNHAQRNAQGKLVAWKGKPVTYVNDEPCFKRNDGALEKVWFPDGPPPFKNDPGLPDEAYDEATTANYMYMKAHGAFKGGIIPELPPKREWVHWDF